MLANVQPMSVAPGGVLLTEIFMGQLVMSDINEKP